MSAALATPPQADPRVRQRPAKSQVSQSAPGQRQPPLTEVRTLPQTTSAWPLWLKSLLLLQWGSGGLALVLLASLLPLYGTAAFYQYRWGQTYQALTQLEHQERELLITHQAQRYKITERLEKQSSPPQLIPQTPKQVLFIPRPTQPQLTPRNSLEVVQVAKDDPTVSY